MKKRILTLALAVLLALSLCVSALAFDPMSPPTPGAAEGFVETKAEWDSSNMLAGHRTTASSYTYDDAGRILTRTEVFTDADNPEENSKQTYLYEYDSEGRLSRTAREDGNHEFVYAYMQDGSHYLTYTWWDDSDESHETRTNTRTYDPCAKWYWFGEWTFSFDDHGNLTRRVSKDGTDIVYENTYDDAGRLSLVKMTSQSDGVQETQTYDYQADGSYVLTWGSKTGAEIFTYNAKGQLVQYSNTYWEDAEGWKYTYDENGNNILRTHGDATSMKYTYEAIPTPEPSTQPTTPPVTSFSDVAADAYYAEPVSWAVNHVPQITNGTGEGKFSPDADCTRGQIVTFLWRAKGEPEPKSTDNPFVDVKESDYFYKAVLWAVEEGITKGTSANEFSPNASCTRAQAVTFLHRAEDEPAAKTQKSEFTDVQDASAYFYTPVLWAVENGITNGTGNSKFSPDATCTRGQIVTFLYRDMA